MIIITGGDVVVIEKNKIFSKISRKGGNMKDEINGIPEEMASIKDNKSPEEMASVKDNKSPEEMVSVLDNTITLEEISEENPKEFKTKPNKKDNSSLISRISTSLVVGAVAATTIIVPAIASKDINVSIEFSDVYVTDTSMECGVYIDDPTLAEFTLTVTNDFTNRVFPIEEEENSFLLENLASNMEYNIAVTVPASFGQKKVLADMKVRTLSEDDYRTARFNGVVTECRCDIDNKFYFTMDFVDHLGVYTEFYAYLEDEEGNRDSCMFNYDLHSEQSILLETINLDSNVTFVILGYVKDGDDVKEVEFFNALVSV